MSYIYLAGPYSHPNGAVMHARFCVHQEAAVWAFNRGDTVFSPIVHWHEAAQRYNLETHYRRWEKDNLAMLEGAALLRVIELPGLEQSKGTAAEMGWAAMRQIPVEIWSPSELKSYQTYEVELFTGATPLK